MDVQKGREIPILARIVVILCGLVTLVLSSNLASAQEWVKYQTKLKKTPPPRAGHAMVFDGKRGRIVLFGGVTTNGEYLNDTWQWNGKNWRLIGGGKSIPSTAPPARGGHAMAYDGKRKRVILFGGSSGKTYYNDIWELKSSRWVNRTTSDVKEKVIAGNWPEGREGHTMVYDSKRAKVVMYGGSARVTIYHDLWERIGGNWKNRTPSDVFDRINSGTWPLGRVNHAMVYGGMTGRVIIYGGSAGGRYYHDCWERIGGKWISRTPTNVMDRINSGTWPEGRENHVMSFDSGRGGIVMFGGSAGDRYYHGVWERIGGRLSAWKDRTPSDVWDRISSGIWPGGRANHAMAYDSSRNRMVMFGGSDDEGNHYNDTWAYKVATSVKH